VPPTTTNTTGTTAGQEQNAPSETPSKRIYGTRQCTRRSKLVVQAVPHSRAMLHLFGPKFEFFQQHPQRQPLADLTNTQPIKFNSPIKRSRSEPLPGMRIPAVIAPQSPLSLLGRAAIVTLSADKQPTKVIAHKLATSEKTVKKWVARFEEDATMEDVQRSGRPWKTREDDRINIVVTAYLEKFVTPKRIKALLDLRNISARSIRRILDAAGLFGRISRISRISPPLTDAHLMRRRGWAEGYKHFTFKDWAKILWSDEASALCGNYGQVWVQRRVGEAWNPEYVTHREKHPDKVHMWGCFSAQGMGWETSICSRITLMHLSWSRSLMNV
jgi:transposase